MILVPAGRSPEGFGGLGRALTNPISRGRRPRSAIPTHCEMNLGSVRRMAQWPSRVIIFGTGVVVLGHETRVGVQHEPLPKAAHVIRKWLYGNYLQEGIYSTTAILSASERGSHKRPFASRAMFLTDELAAGIG
jgi:hypothetical protein